MQLKDKRMIEREGWSPIGHEKLPEDFADAFQVSKRGRKLPRKFHTHEKDSLEDLVFGTDQDQELFKVSCGLLVIGLLIMVWIQYLCI